MPATRGGIRSDRPLREAVTDGVDKLIAVNGTGITLGAQLVNMTSAVYGQPDIAVCSTSTFYVAGLTKALNLEWHKEGIRVLDIWPLWVKTSLAEVDVASTRRLDVWLTPGQVAVAVWRAVHPKNRWAHEKGHHGVSMLG